jgi:hypothetical protein
LLALLLVILLMVMLWSAALLAPKADLKFSH